MLETNVTPIKYHEYCVSLRVFISRLDRYMQQSSPTIFEFRDNFRELIIISNKNLWKHLTEANHRRWKSKASVNCRYYVLIRPVPIRSFAVRYNFPRNDTVAPHVWRRRELAVCNRFWCRPPHRYLSSLTNHTKQYQQLKKHSQGCCQVYESGVDIRLSRVVWQGSLLPTKGEVRGMECTRPKIFEFFV